MRDRCAALIPGLMVAALAIVGPVTSPPAEARSMPFPVTESRERCEDFQKCHKPQFGELHIHTSYSIDAAIADTRNDPRASYAFARGEGG